MAHYTFETENMQAGSMEPMAKAMILLRTMIDNDSLLYELDLAMTEACANIVRHAYPEGAACPAEVLLRVRPGKEVEVEISDWGRGINSECIVAELPGETAESGRGIPLMTDLCDRVTFSCEEGKNTVTLLKNVPKPFWRE